MDYDAIFFYGPSRQLTAIHNISAEPVQQQSTLYGTFDLRGRKMGDGQLPRGIYIVRSAEGTKKIFVK